MTDLAERLTQLRTWKTEAEAARHLVMTGGGVQEIWRDGRRITYSNANVSDLDRYIGWLTSEITSVEGQIAGTASGRRRGFGVIWGSGL